jgi:cytochrome c oxidase subunit II
VNHARPQTGEVLALIALFLGITVFTVVGFAKDWMPPVASQHGVGVDGVIHYLLHATGPILVLGALVLMWFLWRYGRGRPTPAPRTSPRVEFWWSIAPVIGMVAITEVGVVVKGLPVWEEIYAQPPANAIRIDVTAQQFEWIVRYPGPDGKFGRVAADLVESSNPAGLDSKDSASLDDIVLRNQIHVPLGQPVYITLRGRDVLHSFSVPALRVKQDVVPGILNKVLFVATKPGRYEIACTQVCGMGHYRMHGALYVDTPADYADWLHHQTAWLQQQ